VSNKTVVEDYFCRWSPVHRSANKCAFDPLSRGLGTVLSNVFRSCVCVVYVLYMCCVCVCVCVCVFRCKHACECVFCLCETRIRTRLCPRVAKSRDKYDDDRIIGLHVKRVFYKREQINWPSVWPRFRSFVPQHKRASGPL